MPAEAGIDVAELASRFDEERLDLHHDQQAVRHALDQCHERFCRASPTVPERQKITGLQALRAHAERYAEEHARIDEAIVREKMMKAWNRNWKLRQMVDVNPDWRDLFETIHN